MEIQPYKSGKKAIAGLSGDIIIIDDFDHGILKMKQLYWELFWIQFFKK